MSRGIQMKESFAIESDLGHIQKGKVKGVQYDHDLGEDSVWLENKGQKIMIARSKLELYELKGGLHRYMGQMIAYEVIGYDSHRQVYYGSCLEVKRQKRRELIKRLETGQPFLATVTRLTYFGAYLTIDGISVILRNKDFAADYTTVADVYRVGEQIEVCFLKANTNLKINVQAVTKYVQTSAITINDFEPHTIVYGTIRSIKPWACFVNLAPNLDAICPIPLALSAKEGMSVAFRIHQVRKEEGKVRGKIIKIIENQPFSCISMA